MSDAPRDPIAEQDEAARVFLERTGRKSTDPAPPGILHMRITPTAVFGRFPGGTDPRAAVHAVFSEMFEGTFEEVPASGYARKGQSKYPDAIEADVIEDDTDSEESGRWRTEDAPPDGKWTVSYEICAEDDPGPDDRGVTSPG
jgi:hypothetical protein